MDEAARGQLDGALQAGTGPVPHEDSISPEFYELEVEAVFKRAWLNVGRVDLLARNGSYFTKEIEVAKTSVVVVRDMDGEVRAFHNICRHRGNKLVWNDFPKEETAGVCRQFTCKYHGWRYNLDGALDLRPARRRVLRPRQGRLRAGARALRRVGGLHLHQPGPRARAVADRVPRTDGPGLEGYPFDKMTERWFYRSEIKSNWKLFSDNIEEFYHAPVLHAGQMPPAFAAPNREPGSRRRTTRSTDRTGWSHGEASGPGRCPTACSSRWRGPPGQPLGPVGALRHRRGTRRREPGRAASGGETSPTSCGRTW